MDSEFAGENAWCNQEDARKIHAEINQLQNQRFLATTGAITAIGVFAGWTSPRPEYYECHKYGATLILNCFVVQVVLALFYYWNSVLTRLQANLSNYLILSGSSRWETLWERFQPNNDSPAAFVTTSGKNQRTVLILLAVGALVYYTLLVPIFMGIAHGGWFGISVMLLIPYAIMWCTLDGSLGETARSVEEKVKERWKKVLRS